MASKLRKVLSIRLLKISKIIVDIHFIMSNNSIVVKNEADF